uniref:EF-hand domain-containing protein n=1 Tax=Arcella intermedia TaxID=1963864 RepID=A0A6B2LQA0_9EUKA
MSKEQVEEFMQSFKLFDKNSDGIVNIAELETILRSLGQTPSKEELATMIKDVDTEGKGEISGDQFLVMMATKMQETIDPIEACFGAFDKNKDRRIDATELQAVMESLGEKLTLEEIKVMIRALAAPGEDHVTFDTFAKLAKSQQKI